MRKQMIESAAFEVATQVRAVEDSIDTTLAEIAELQSRMIRAHAATGTGAGTSHAAFEQQVAATQALIGARGSMVGCHSALVDAKQRIPGLRTVGFGDTEKCPTTAQATLRVDA